MDSWEWPREFWHMPPPWEAEEFADYYNQEADLFTPDEWEESASKAAFLSLEELEDLEEEAIWDEEFDFDDPTHLYLFMDEYEYLQQSRQPELRELIEEEEAWSEDTPEPSMPGPALDDAEDTPSSQDTTHSVPPSPHDDENAPR